LERRGQNMRDSCPMTDVRFEVLKKVHERLEKMDKEGIDIFDSLVKLRDEIKKGKVKLCSD